MSRGDKGASWKWGPGASTVSRCGSAKHICCLWIEEVRKSLED